MGCNCGQLPCSELPECTCPVRDLSSDCSVYTGADLACSGIESGTVMTQVLKSLDAFICNKFNEAIVYLTLVNVGIGAQVYKGINGIGNKQLRTITSGDSTLVDIVQQEDTIDVTPGTPSMTFDENTDILSFIITTLGGSNNFADIDLSKYNYDTFVQGASFNSGTLDLTITRNNGEPDIVVPLDFLYKYVSSGQYLDGTNTIRLTLTDTTTVDIDVATLTSEILAAAASAQVQADFLETNNTSKAFIQNKNPEKTVVLGVAGNYNVVDADNNYLIEIDNGANDVTIDLANITLTSNFFVGFLQKGTGTVTYLNYNIKPSALSDVVFGQGHTTAVQVINSVKYISGTFKSA